MRYTNRYMLGISDKRVIRKLLVGKIGVIVLLIIFILFARGTWGVYKKSSFAKENKDRASQELKSLYEHEVMLTKELEHLGTKRGMEEEVRHKFDVGREGENLIVLIDSPQEEVFVEQKDTSIWSRIVGFFGIK